MPLRRLIACLLVFGSLVVSASALAMHQDPEKRLTKADNARAKAMLIKLPDLRAGFRPQPSNGPDPHYDCSPSVSESDLTLTGEAEGRQLTFGVTFVSSASQVYGSVADASASWRRSTSASGTECATQILSSEFAKQGVRLVSLRKVSFPRVSQRSVAYRVELSAMTPQGTASVYVDIVALSHTRSHASVILGSALIPPPRADELRLARLVAGRMAAAMRG